MREYEARDDEDEDGDDNAIPLVGENFRDDNESSMACRNCPDELSCKLLMQPMAFSDC